MCVSVSVCHKGHCTQSKWKTLTLPRTGGQTMFLLRSERPFSHYAAALIYRNTKIRLNGAIFSFAFGGHFSCLENSTDSDGTRGSIVIIACSARVRRPGLHSQADSPRPELELPLHHTSSCVARGRSKGKGGKLLSHGLINKREEKSPLTALSMLLLDKPCTKPNSRAN